MQRATCQCQNAAAPHLLWAPVDKASDHVQRRYSRHMREPHRKRPRWRARSTALSGQLLDECAQKAQYVGSPEHKTYPSFAGQPKLRSDGTACPPDLKDADVLPEWLRQALP
jgi:hypothetical protein